MKNSIALIALATVVGLAGSAEAKSLRSSLIPGSLQGNPVLEGALNPLANAIGSQVANQIPALSTSAGYTYEWNPELEVLERSAKTFGPLFSERAVTLGRNKFNFNVSYTYIKFDEFNGKNLDKLVNNVEVARVPETGQNEYFGLFRGFDCDADGENCLRQSGDRVTLDLDLEAQLFDFSFTYGILDSLDVNIDIPVVRTYLRSSVQQTLPDPRCLDPNISNSDDCQAVLDSGLGPNVVGGQGGFFVFPPEASRETSLGIGDIHLRTKWAPITNPVRLAGLLDLGIPTGNAADFQGTGDSRIATTLIASRDLGSMIELHSQGGVEFNINDVDRSQARYAAGVTAQLASFMAVTVDFLGRSEFGAQGRIKNTGRLPAVREIDGVDTLTQPRGELNSNENFKGRPFFVDIKRNDVLDLAVGGRFAIGDRAMILANFLVPLNQDGLRADFVPTIAIETNF
jgi:hypothetical protein